MRDELYQHKRSDKIKWIITFVAIFLAFVMLIALCMQIFGHEKLKPENWFKKSGQTEKLPEEEDEENGGAVVSESVGHGIKLMSARISPDEFEDYGISAQAETAIQLTVVITPANASVQDIDWTCGWVNENSAWASGKNISDYYGFSSFGTRLANAVCYRPFSEPIWVKATSVDNPSITATATANYIKRITPSFELREYVNDQLVNASTVDYDGSYVFDLTETYSDGTLAGTVKYSNYKHVYTSAAGDAQIFGDLEDAICREYNDTKQSSDPHMDGCYFQYDGFTYQDDYFNEYLITKEEDAVFSVYTVFECISDAGKKLTNQRVTNAKGNQLYRMCGKDTLRVTVSFDYLYTYNGVTYGSGTVSKTYNFDCTSLGVAVSGLSLNRVTLNY